jgi:hypothetical protein
VRDRGEIAEDELQYYDGVVERAKMGVAGLSTPGLDYFKQLMASPPMAFHLAHVGKFGRLAGDRGDSLTHADREWIDEVLSVDMKTNILLPIHLPEGIASGVRIEAVEAIREGREEDLTDEERQLTDFIRQMVSGTVTAEAWEAMEQRFGERGVIEYSILICYIHAATRLRQAIEDSRLYPPPSNEDIDAMIQDIKSGGRELPDFRVRHG